MTSHRHRGVGRQCAGVRHPRPDVRCAIPCAQIGPGGEQRLDGLRHRRPECARPLATTGPLSVRITMPVPRPPRQRVRMSTGHPIMDRRLHRAAECAMPVPCLVGPGVEQRPIASVWRYRACPPRCAAGCGRTLPCAGLAPAARSTSTTSIRPPCAASCSGVRPSLSLGSGSAPAARHARILSISAASEPAVPHPAQISCARPGEGPTSKQTVVAAAIQRRRPRAKVAYINLHD